MKWSSELLTPYRRPVRAKKTFLGRAIDVKSTAECRGIAPVSPEVEAAIMEFARDRNFC